MPAINKPLSIERINQSIPFGNVHYFEAIDSTNTWLQENGQCGDVCISDMQIHGRGRRGNHWLSPSTGNVYFSLCWCFEKITEYWSLLGLVVGIATVQALKEVGLTGQGIKWPNDIFWQQKKLGGILLETVDQSGKIIIGIGLNIAMPEKEIHKIDQQIVSLNEALPNTDYSREQIIIHLIQQLHIYLSNFPDLTFNAFLADWQPWDILQGEPVNIIQQGSCTQGTVVKIDQFGRIGILSDDGKVNYYSSADIKLKPKKGSL